MKTAVIVTTFQRPAALARSLPQIVAAAKEVGAPVLVVDDGGQTDLEIERAIRTITCDVLLTLPENRGLAGALNIGLSYWLADPSIEAIHYAQDDVGCDVLAFSACNEVLAAHPSFLVTAHDAREHHEKPHSLIVDAPGPVVNGIRTRVRPSCRATHMAMTRQSWIDLMPIPSRGLGLPKRVPRAPNEREQRGEGSGCDWHCCRDSAKAKRVLCVPGLLRTFAFTAADSTWSNPQIAGEDDALHRDAIKEWVEARAK